MRNRYTKQVSISLVTVFSPIIIIDFIPGKATLSSTVVNHNLWNPLQSKIITHWQVISIVETIIYADTIDYLVTITSGNTNGEKSVNRTNGEKC